MQGCEEEVKKGAVTDGWEEKATNEREEKRDNKTKAGKRGDGEKRKSKGIRGMDRW